MTFTPSNLSYYKMQHNNTVCINNVIHAESFEKPSKHLLELNPSFNQKRKSIKKRKKKNPEVTLKQIPSRVLALSSCHNTWKNLSTLAPCRLPRLSCHGHTPTQFCPCPAEQPCQPHKRDLSFSIT